MTQKKANDIQSLICPSPSHGQRANILPLTHKMAGGIKTLNNSMQRQFAVIVFGANKAVQIYSLRTSRLNR